MPGRGESLRGQRRSERSGRVSPLSPEIWAKDEEKRRRARVPDDVVFQKKWQIALDEIDRLLADGVPRAPLVMDAGYGTVTELRDELVARDLIYVAGVQSEVTVWPEGEMPAAPKTYSGQGRPPTLLRRSQDAQPVSLVDLALRLQKSAWRSIRWRGGAKGDMRSRLARVRVRAAHRDYWRREPRAEEWLLIEWPTGENAPTKYWLSNISARASISDLVHLAKVRWRIERDYQELKDEIGIDQPRGLHSLQSTTWRGHRCSWDRCSLLKRAQPWTRPRSSAWPSRRWRVRWAVAVWPTAGRPG